MAVPVSSFEEQFKDLTSLITFFQQCSRETQEFIDNMRQELSDSIERDLISDTERQRLRSYTAKKATLLIVGQTNSGKSSFVNELLGGSFVPTSEVPCTSRIVRLKYSEENYYQVNSVLMRRVFIGIMESRAGIVVRSIASHQYGPGSIPALCVICGLRQVFFAGCRLQVEISL